MKLSHSFSAVVALPIAALAGSISSFQNIIASDTLEWWPCYENFTCANLLVPLDYANASAGYTNIAFLKDDAPIQPAKDILVNPGGPGGSGVNYVRNGHEKLRRNFGRRYNIVGFDPRSVNNSGPHLDYYPCMGKPLVKMKKSEQAWCKDSLANGAAKYAGTVAVVQDMLNFIELRNEELGKPGDEAKLLFYGASYGTALGATFAATYPDRIERMILDAVMDSAKYYRADKESLANDAADVIGHFAPMCFAAGPERCAFHRGSKAAAHIEARIQAIFGRLSRGDIIAPNPEGPGRPPYALDAIDLGYAMFMMAYNPLTSFPTLANVLVDLEKGDGQKLLKALTKSSRILADQAGDKGQGAMIQCLDPAAARSKKRLAARRSNMPFVAIQYILGGQDNICNDRNLVPPPSQRFLGFTETKTSFPILFVGTSADPVTPIRGAHAMSKYFPGSVILKQDSIGHSYSSSPSKCTRNYVHGYLAGIVPPTGTVCKPDRLPFEEGEAELDSKVIFL